MCKKYGKRFPIKWAIKGPDNPTSQLLPIISKKCGSRDGEGRKEKGGGGGSRSKTKLCVCVTKLYVKDGVWQRKMVCVCDQVVCERWCVTKKDGVCVWQSCVCERWCVCESCLWKRACDKVVYERWCVTKWCVKDGVWNDKTKSSLLDKKMQTGTQHELSPS